MQDHVTTFGKLMCRARATKSGGMQLSVEWNQLSPDYTQEFCKFRPQTSYNSENLVELYRS